MKALNLSGKTFGRLTALYPTVKRSGGNIIWRCLCQCGVETEVATDLLTSHRTKSCGCYKKETSRKTGYNNKRQRIGEVVGHLTVLADSGKRGSRNDVIWTCVCSCGNLVDVVGSNLGRSTKSCGHLNQAKHPKHIRVRNKIYTIRRKERERQLDCAWTKDMENALIHMQPVCVVCGSIDRLSTDHVMPLSLGYGLRPGNAVRLCIHCNSTKKNKHINKVEVGMRQKILNAATDFELNWNNQ